MAESVTAKDEPSNPCCVIWKEKYAKLKERHSKLEDGRNALRKGLSVLEPQITKIQAEDVRLKKALEDERMRENSEKDDRAKEPHIRVASENEVSSSLKSLHQNDESEINRLKELSEKERKRGDVEKKKAEAERKKADEAAKKIKAENSKANDEKRRAIIEMAKVEKQRKAAEANWKMAMDEKRRCDYVSQQLKKTSRRVEELEEEIHELVSRKKLVELPVDRPVSQPSSIEICSEITKRRINAGVTCKSLERVEHKLIKEKKWAKLEKKRVEEQRQVAGAYKKVTMEEKHHSDQLSRELECYKQSLTEVKEEIQNLISSRIRVESSKLASNGRLEAQTAKMKLLREKLKFEKLRRSMLKK